VTAIDISPDMAAIARENFRGKPVQVLCGDAAETAYHPTFHCIVVYNAFPHFADPERLIERLAAALSPGGSLTIAHGMRRERIDAHHGSVPEDVSDRLMPVEALAAVLKRYLRVTVQISDDRMYQAVAVRDA
jgi:demethylmenaquinone methyltransferase/2-methoxy-6-polyprenyl-1,4-benzoquinol methylase